MAESHMEYLVTGIVIIAALAFIAWKMGLLANLRGTQQTTGNFGTTQQTPNSGTTGGMDSGGATANEPSTTTTFVVPTGVFIR